MAKSTTNKGGGKRRPHVERYTSKEYRPYVMAIGQVALAWNDLNEALVSLFTTLVGAGIDFKLQAALQSVTSDKVRRGMLRAQSMI